MHHIYQKCTKLPEMPKMSLERAYCVRDANGQPRRDGSQRCRLQHAGAERRTIALYRPRAARSHRPRSKRFPFGPTVVLRGNVRKATAQKPTRRNASSNSPAAYRFACHHRPMSGRISQFRRVMNSTRLPSRETASFDAIKQFELRVVGRRCTMRRSMSPRKTGTKWRRGRATTAGRKTMTMGATPSAMLIIYIRPDGCSGMSIA